MEAVETTYPLERIVDEIVRTEFQCEVLSAKSIRKTERKLEHYETLRKEMLLRHQWEVNNMDTIIQSYKKPLELHGKTMARKQEKLAELRGKLAERDKAISSLNALPPPAIPEEAEESDDERVATELGYLPTSLGTHNCKIYSIPK